MVKKRVLTVCGTGGFGSAAIAMKIRETAKSIGVEVDVVSVKVIEVQSQLDRCHYDLIVAATPVKDGGGVPIVNGIPLMTGIGVEEIMEQIVKVLSE